MSVKVEQGMTKIDQALKSSRDGSQAHVEEECDTRTSPSR
jgi:hypothetical protein